MKHLLFLAFPLMILSSCGSSVSDAYEKGLMYNKWTYDSIEPYKEGSEDEAFMKKVSVTPIRLDFSEAKESGKFKGFYPNQDSRSSDYFVSKDISGKVSFKLNDDKIHATFDDVRSRGSFEMKDFFIHSLDENHMEFEMGDPYGNLYLVKMKKD